MLLSLIVSHLEDGFMLVVMLMIVAAAAFMVMVMVMIMIMIMVMVMIAVMTMVMFAQDISSFLQICFDTRVSYHKYSPKEMPFSGTAFSSICGCQLDVMVFSETTVNSPLYRKATLTT